MAYTVGAVARLAGVTVRTLHHYDEIGLLSPGGRSQAGYRRYGVADLERLQRILFYRELGFGLDQIKTMMTDGQADAVVHLRRQHQLLRDRIGRLERMAAAVQKAMEAQTMGISLTPDERFEVFGDHDPEADAAEAAELWGTNDPYAQARRRAASYSKADWLRHKAESQAVNDRLAAAMRSGLPPTSAEAMDAAEAHRLTISRWFYDCPIQMHVGLGEMYVADPRCAATYEQVAAGLAQYVRDAIVVNAARAR